MPAAPVTAATFPISLSIGLASVEGQSVGRMLGDRVGPGQHAASVVERAGLDQAAVDHINASQVLGYRDDRLLEPPRQTAYTPTMIDDYP